WAFDSDPVPAVELCVEIVAACDDELCFMPVGIRRGIKRVVVNPDVALLANAHGELTLEFFDELFDVVDFICYFSHFIYFFMFMIRGLPFLPLNMNYYTPVITITQVYNARKSTFFRLLAKNLRRRILLKIFFSPSCNQASRKMQPIAYPRCSTHASRSLPRTF